jgi:hypothetical protein
MPGHLKLSRLLPRRLAQARVNLAGGGLLAVSGHFSCKPTPAIPIDLVLQLSCGTTITLQTCIPPGTDAATLHATRVLSLWPGVVPPGAKVHAIVFRRAT